MRERLRALPYATELGFIRAAKPAWSEPAVRLLYGATPRLYQPLVDGWSHVFPGTKRALTRLRAWGLVKYQPGFVLRVGEAPPGHDRDPGGRLAHRVRITGSGRSVLRDPRVSGLVHGPKRQILELLATHRELRTVDLIDRVKFSEQTVRNHVNELAQAGLVSKREPSSNERLWVPSHWVPTPELARSLRLVYHMLPTTQRERYYGQVLVGARLHQRSRVHDVLTPGFCSLPEVRTLAHAIEVQQLFGRMCEQNLVAPTSRLQLEQVTVLSGDRGDAPWEALRVATVAHGPARYHYRPDAEFSCVWPDEPNPVTTILEYGRRQRRAETWMDLWKFLGWVRQTQTFSFMKARLLFVTDSPARARAYRQAVNRFVEFARHHPEQIPPNPMAVSVLVSGDTLNLSDAWTVPIPPGREDAVVPIPRSATADPRGRW